MIQIILLVRMLLIVPLFYWYECYWLYHYSTGTNAIDCTIILLVRMLLIVPLFYWYECYWLYHYSTGTNAIDCTIIILVRMLLIVPLLYWYECYWLYHYSTGTNAIDCTIFHCTYNNNWYTYIVTCISVCSNSYALHYTHSLIIFHQKAVHYNM